MNELPVFIGIDAGGTSTRLAMQSSAGVVKKRVGPPAQLQRLGVEGASQVLADLVEVALENRTPPAIESMVAGVAGAGDPLDQQELATALARRMGSYAPRRLHIAQDAEIALEGAFEGTSGMVIIAGTGSVVVARGRDGQYYKVGGWGHLLGDEGSGLILGLEGLRAVARAIDGGRATVLRDLLATAHGIHDRRTLVQHAYQSNWPAQQVAPLVLQTVREGDAVAENILRQQTDALARQAHRLSQQHEDVEPRFALLGGLNNDRTYRKALCEALQRFLPSWRNEKPRQPPVMGALLMARRG